MVIESLPFSLSRRVMHSSQGVRTFFSLYYYLSVVSEVPLRERG
jgi:hypothetical protein